jgi:cell division septation protein DedD
VQRTTWYITLTFIMLAALGLPGLLLADEPAQAGLVIQFQDGRVESRCVTFEGPEISGADLLAHSGLEAILDVSSGMGLTVCQIEGEGCAFPAEHCFCQCMGGAECSYWNYFYREPGTDEWTYSPLGAALRKVKPGSVEGWVWGDGHTPPAGELTFEALCLPATVAPTESPEPPTPTTVGEEPTRATPPTRTPSALPTATALPPSPVPPTVEATEPALTSYWPFGLMVLGLTLVGALVWFRRR